MSSLLILLNKVWLVPFVPHFSFVIKHRLTGTLKNNYRVSLTSTIWFHIFHMQHKYCTYRKRRLFHTIIARPFLLHINRFSWSFDFKKRSTWLDCTSNWLRKRINFSPKNISKCTQQYEKFQSIKS